MEQGFPKQSPVDCEMSNWYSEHTILNNQFRDEAVNAGIQVCSKAFWVYNKLRDYEVYSKKKYCYAKVGRLAEELGYTTRQVTDALARLKKAGLVEHIWAIGNKVKLARGAIYVSVARLGGIDPTRMRVGKERKPPQDCYYLDLDHNTTGHLVGRAELCPNDDQRCCVETTRCCVETTSRPKDVVWKQHLTGTKSLNSNKSLNRSIVPTKSERHEIAQKSNDVKAVIDHWNTVMGGRLVVNDLNRYAIFRLIKRFGVDTLKRVISALPEMLATPYETRVADFVDLEKRWNKVMDWGRRRALSTAKAQAEKKAEEEYKTPF